MSDLHIPSIFLIKGHLYNSDINGIDWCASGCKITTKSGHEITFDRELIRDMVISKLDDDRWEKKTPKNLSKQIADIWEILNKLCKEECLPENTQVQLAQASLLCSDASYTAVGEDPATDGLFTEVRVTMEEKQEKP